MKAPRLASTQADPPRGWSPGLGRPGAPAPTFPSSRKDDGPSSCEYASRSPKGMVAGLGAARRSGSNVPLFAQGWRPLVLRVRKPIPQGDGRRAWGGPALQLPHFAPHRADVDRSDEGAKVFEKSSLAQSMKTRTFALMFRFGG